jgi:dTDP-4-amino-4,6-dideoxygalactose transaminase
MIPFNKPYLVGKELSYISRAVLEGKISGDGSFTKKCSHWLESQTGCKKALLTHSCTAALEMAAILCDIQPGDEIIMPSYTFVSTANAFVLRGGVPVFVDIRSDNLNIDESLIEQAITPKTRAIVCVHYAGVACEMNSIMKTAEKHNLIVIEDAAQALLSFYEGRALGSIGHFGCLSFHETKNVISGEGGALLINDPSFADRAEIIREKGTNRSQFFRGEIDKYTWVDMGSSYLPSEIIAAFLYAQLEEAPRINAKRKEIWSAYFNAFKPLEERKLVTLPVRKDNSDPGNGHIFYLITRSLEERTALITFLKEHGIMAIFHYVPLHSAPAGLKFGRTAGTMLNTDTLSNTIVRLPLFFELNENEIRQIIDSVLLFYAAGE